MPKLIEGNQFNVIERQKGLLFIFHKGLGVLWIIDRQKDGRVELSTYDEGIPREHLVFAKARTMAKLGMTPKYKENLPLVEQTKKKVPARPRCQSSGCGRRNKSVRPFNCNEGGIVYLCAVHRAFNEGKTGNTKLT